MNQKVRHMVYAALIAAMYAALTHLQNVLFPGSATMAIQFRVSEALCVLAFFTKAAVPGLTVGCLLYNLTSIGALPLDPVVGTAATLTAVGGMYLMRHVRLGRFLPALLLPAVANGLLVGWELTVYIGGGFWLNGLYVAIGEAAVLLTLGSLLYAVLKKRNIWQDA